MAKPSERSGLTQKLDAIAAKASPAETADIAAVVEAVMKSLAGDVSLAEFQLYRELENLADYIQSAKREIAAIRPDDIRSRDIPMATDELDAVVMATAEATGVILAAMEEIEQLATKLPAKQAGPLGEAVIRVYEACGFQDITGQRITKVVRTLKHIESKIDALLAVFGGEHLALPELPPPPPPADEHASLLNGPALPSAAGNTQADIDALLASFD